MVPSTAPRCMRTRMALSLVMVPMLMRCMRSIRGVLTA
jgi:hypothetical protein